MLACSEAGPPVAPAAAAVRTATLSAANPSTATVAAPAPTPETELRFAAVTIRRALEADLAREVGAADAGALAQVVKRVLVWWLDPRRDLRKGDRIDVVWSPVPDAEPVAHAIWLNSEKIGAKVAVHLEPDAPVGFARWVDPSRGEEVALRLRHSPVQDYEQITSLVNDGRSHRGVDFKAPEGTPILAPYGGKVLRRNWKTRANGYCLEIEYDGGKHKAYFLHLSKIEPSVRPGTRVKAGQKIAEVGNTGRSFAPHLHYQLESARGLADPFRVHPSWRAEISAEALERAKLRLHQLSQMRTSGAMQ